MKHIFFIVVRVLAHTSEHVTRFLLGTAYVTIFNNIYKLVRFLSLTFTTVYVHFYIFQ
jgi:hypothetical protein